MIFLLVREPFLVVSCEGAVGSHGYYGIGVGFVIGSRTFGGSRGASSGAGSYLRGGALIGIWFGTLPSPLWPVIAISCGMAVG